MLTNANANSNGSDLHLMSAWGPTRASIGDLINVSWTVNNDSVVAANGYWYDAVYLSSDAVLDENDTETLYRGAGPLGAKSNYSHDASFSIPYIGNAGQYYLIFSADALGEQAETDESNNDLAVPINLDINGPDLQIISASAPTVASVGSPITVSWTVKNQGVAPASNNWWDVIYLSIDAILDENDFYAGQYFNDAPLSVESSYIRSLSFSIPSISEAGQYNILFSTDDYGCQGETDESNNDLAVPINLDLNGPDLQLVSASAPASASAGSPITVSWTVKNQGVATASYDWYDQIYLSKDSLYDYSDTFVSAFSAADQSPLAASSSYTQTKTISAPSTDTAGQYYLIFLTNSYSEQGETSKANNDLAVPISLDLIGPDLKLISASAPAAASVGSSITVSWTVKNQGVATASNDWYDQIYLSKDSLYDYSDTFVTSFSAADQSPLAAGSSYTLTKTISAPSTDTAGQYYLIIRTNPYSDQGETSKANNDFALPINLDLNAPDLNLVSASAPTAASVGSPITVSWTVKNQGVATANNDWSDQIYLSKDSLYDYSDTFVTSFSAADQSPLAAGSSYTLTKTISAPSTDTAGQYYLIIRTNPYSDQGEISKANNDIALPISLDLNAPDLNLVSASAPAAASVGSPITVSWTVKNQGVATANNDWSDQIYLSKDSLYDYSDTFVTSFSAADQSPLAAGSSYTLTKTISAPSTDTAGQYYLIIRTNPYSDQGEISKANNDIALPISLDLNAPDLKLASASAPAAASAGSPITVSWTVTNQGVAKASNDWFDLIYLSKDSLYDYSDTFVTAFSAADQSPLAAGSSYTQTKTISAPSTDTAGQYYLIFRTNPYSDQGETSKANNDFAVPISLDLKGADPIVTLAVSPSAVAEDGSSNLIYTFSRTGDTSNGLSVYYALGGTATRGIDYTGIAATWTPFRSVSFAAGTASATITVDPTVDSEIESNESIGLSLYPGYGYIIGTTAWVVGTILNDDTVIEHQGNTKLLRRGDGIAFVEPGAGTRQEITVPWGVSATVSDNNEWQMLAADTITGFNQVLWRNNTSSFLHIWNLDANWNLQSTSGADGFNTPKAWELEASFQVDGNRDGIIGAPFTPLEAQGNTKLLKRGDGIAFVETGAGTRQEITVPWGVSATVSDNNEWQMLAAEKIGDTNQVLWRNNNASFLHIWNLDANWNLQSTSGAYGFNTPAAWELETNFQVDGNHDGIIGAPV